MTIEEIKQAIEEIKSVSGDSEMAHGKEDILNEAFIHYIATGGCEDLQEKAKLIATVSAMDFTRWYA